MNYCLNAHWVTVAWPYTNKTGQGDVRTSARRDQPVTTILNICQLVITLNSKCYLTKPAEPQLFQNVNNLKSWRFKAFLISRIRIYSLIQDIMTGKWLITIYSQLKVMKHIWLVVKIYFIVWHTKSMLPLSAIPQMISGIL